MPPATDLDDGHANGAFKVAIAYSGRATQFRLVRKTLELVANLPLVSRTLVRADPTSPYIALAGGATFGDARLRSLKKKWRISRTDLHPQHAALIQVDVVGPKASTMRAINSLLALAFHDVRSDVDGQWTVQAYEVNAFLDECMTRGKPLPHVVIETRLTEAERARRSLEVAPARLCTLIDPACHNLESVVEDGTLVVAGELFPPNLDALAEARSAQLKAQAGDGDECAKRLAAAIDAAAAANAFQQSYLPAIMDRLRRHAAALAIALAEEVEMASASAPAPAEALVAAA